MTKNKTTKRDWFGVILGFFVPIFLFIFILTTQQYLIKVDKVYRETIIKIGYYDKVFNHLNNICYRVSQSMDQQVGYNPNIKYNFPNHSGVLCSVLLLPHTLPGELALLLALSAFAFGFCWYRKLNPFKFIFTIIKSLGSVKAQEELLQIVETPDNHKNYFMWGVVVFFILLASLFLALPILMLIF